MLDFTQIKVGDKVFVVYSGNGWGDAQYTPAEVVKVTPSGLFDVVMGTRVSPVRFNTRGHEPGRHYGGLYVDDQMDFATREASVAKGGRIRAAAKAINAITEKKLEQRFSQTDVVKALALIEKLVAEAKQLVDAI